MSIISKKNSPPEQIEPVKFDYQKSEKLKLSALNDTSSDLESKSDEHYRVITSRILDISENQLSKQSAEKTEIKKTLQAFFIVLLGLQLLVLFVIIFIKGFCDNFNISDTVIITIITSIFVETLGAVIIMVRYSFNSEQEIEAIKILNSVVENYQKYKCNK